MNNYSQILEQAYSHFILNIEGKKVAIPYRINIPPIEHPARQGKSSPEVILKQLYEDAREQGFDLKKASVESVEEVRGFMRKNHLGLDCSGFVYRMLDFLVQEAKGKPLTKLGFDHVGRTNVTMLTDSDHSIKIDPKDLQPGDIIKTNSLSKIPHILIVMARKDNLVTYAHSSKDSAGITKFSEDLNDIIYDTKAGDGPRRLKVL